MPVYGINFLFSRAVRLSSALCIILLLAPARPSSAQIAGEVVVTSRFANIRSGPGTKFARLGRAFQGDKFSVMDYRKQWYEIMYKGRVAWVIDKLVRFEKTMPSQAEVSQVSAEIERLNQRLDRVLEKINQAGDLLEQQIKQKEMPVKGSGRKKGQAGGVAGHGRIAPALAFVPGGPRLAAGQKILGIGGLAATAGCAAAGVWYQNKYRDYWNDYRALPQEATAEQFNNLHDKASSRRRLSQGFFYAAAGLYALNVLDCFFILPRTGAALQVNAAPAGGQKVSLSLSCSF